MTIFIGTSLKAQPVAKENVRPYEYDTVLKGGYSILLKVDDSLQYLYLKKGNRTIAELSSTSKGMLYKSLGYVGADFTNYFVLVHSFGSGNAHQIELINKKTGANLLKDGAAWIDADEKKEFLLYSENETPNRKDKMILYNVGSGKKYYLRFPNDIFEGPQVLYRIESTKLSNKQLVIMYRTKKGLKTKAYNL
ncbi:hypothetical protein [Foetidibacter luteolus]|uniref:hypothetical protein n=1 Tax=Foetidibacter luteolus TaxID=2608880 RepID=UPI00129A2259|nr:hypothetical protein [Foetidibacter luteolus]